MRDAAESDEEYLAGQVEKHVSLSTASSSVESFDEEECCSTASSQNHNSKLGDFDNKISSVHFGSSKGSRRRVLGALKRLSSRTMTKGKGQSPPCSPLESPLPMSPPATVLASCSISVIPSLKSCMSVRTVEESLRGIKNVQDDHTTLCEEQDCRVGFDKVRIRQHARTVGDNPSASLGGPPISLGWAYLDKETVLNVDTYEAAREPQRRKSEDLKLPAMVRRHILQKRWGIPDSVLGRMEEDAYTVQHNRSLTYSYRCFDKTEEVLETVMRRTKRFVRGKSKKRQEQWLWQNAALRHGKSVISPSQRHEVPPSDNTFLSTEHGTSFDFDDDCHVDYGEDE